MSKGTTIELPANCRAHAETCPGEPVFAFIDLGSHPKEARGFCARHAHGAAMAAVEMTRSVYESRTEAYQNEKGNE